MSLKPKVAVLVGSLRKDSITRKLARDISERAAGSLTCTLVEIGDLPHYNQDLETDTPAAGSACARSLLPPRRCCSSLRNTIARFPAR